MKKILVIDDEPQLRTLLRTILVREGFAVQEAADGRVGLDMWRKEPADIVLTDIFMPNKDGIEMIVELKRMQPQAKIIAMTGGGETKLLEIGSAAGFLGADRTIEKPFDRKGLLTVIQSLLNDYRHADESGARVCDMVSAGFTPRHESVTVD